MSLSRVQERLDCTLSGRWHGTPAIGVDLSDLKLGSDMSRSRILVAEDSPTQATQVKQLLERMGYQAQLTGNGREALLAIQQSHPDLILADLIMPEMNGMRLVEEVRARYPHIPVILMTGHGSEEIASAALQKGAVGYIPKRRLEADLQRTLQGVLGLARSDRRHRELLDCLDLIDSQFTLGPNPALFSQLVSHVQDSLELLNFGDDALRIRLSVALTECLDNAHYHGNLELHSSLREGDGRRWTEESLRRRSIEPYKDRMIHVRAQLSRSRAEFTIRDEGPGFDLNQLPDPRDADNLELVSGRGILMIRTFMDEVHFSGSGNQIRMVKFRD